MDHALVAGKIFGEKSELDQFCVDFVVKRTYFGILIGGVQVIVVH